MASKPLPIEGYPHMTLAGQDDEAVYERTLAGLRAAGFRVEDDRLVPPEGAKSGDVIAAITHAFQQAKGTG